MPGFILNLVRLLYLLLMVTIVRNSHAMPASSSLYEDHQQSFRIKRQLELVGPALQTVGCLPKFFCGLNTKTPGKDTNAWNDLAYVVRFAMMDNDDLDEEGNLQKAKDGIKDDYESEESAKDRERTELALELQAEEELIMEDPGFLNLMWRDLKQKLRKKLNESENNSSEEDSEEYPYIPTRLHHTNTREKDKSSFFKWPKIRFGRGLGKWFNLKNLLSKEERVTHRLKLAQRIGQVSKSEEKCSTVFNLCPYSVESMMKMIHKQKIYDKWYPNKEGPKKDKNMEDMMKLTSTASPYNNYTNSYHADSQVKFTIVKNDEEKVKTDDKSESVSESESDESSDKADDDDKNSDEKNVSKKSQEKSEEDQIYTRRPLIPNSIEELDDDEAVDKILPSVAKLPNFPISGEHYSEENLGETISFSTEEKKYMKERWDKTDHSGDKYFQSGKPVHSHAPIDPKKPKYKVKKNKPTVVKTETKFASSSEEVQDEQSVSEDESESFEQNERTELQPEQMDQPSYETIYYENSGHANNRPRPPSNTGRPTHYNPSSNARPPQNVRPHTPFSPPSNARPNKTPPNHPIWDTKHSNPPPKYEMGGLPPLFSQSDNVENKEQNQPQRPPWMPQFKDDISESEENSMDEQDRIEAEIRHQENYFQTKQTSSEELDKEKVEEPDSNSDSESIENEKPHDGPKRRPPPPFNGRPPVFTPPHNSRVHPAHFQKRPDDPYEMVDIGPKRKPTKPKKKQKPNKNQNVITGKPIPSVVPPPVFTDKKPKPFEFTPAVPKGQQKKKETYKINVLHLGFKPTEAGSPEESFYDKIITPPKRKYKVKQKPVKNESKSSSSEEIEDAKVDIFPQPEKKDNPQSVEYMEYGGKGIPPPPPVTGWKFTPQMEVKLESPKPTSLNAHSLSNVNQVRPQHSSSESEETEINSDEGSAVSSSESMEYGADDDKTIGVVTTGIKAANVKIPPPPPPVNTLWQASGTGIGPPPPARPGMLPTREQFNGVPPVSPGSAGSGTPGGGTGTRAPGGNQGGNKNSGGGKKGKGKKKKGGKKNKKKEDGKKSSEEDDDDSSQSGSGSNENSDEEENNSSYEATSSEEHTGSTSVEDSVEDGNLFGSGSFEDFFGPHTFFFDEKKAEEKKPLNDKGYPKPNLINKSNEREDKWRHRGGDHQEPYRRQNRGPTSEMTNGRQGNLENIFRKEPSQYQNVRLGSMGNLGASYRPLIPNAFRNTQYHEVQRPQNFNHGNKGYSDNFQNSPDTRYGNPNTAQQKVNYRPLPFSKFFGKKEHHNYKPIESIYGFLNKFGGGR